MAKFTPQAPPGEDEQTRDWARQQFEAISRAVPQPDVLTFTILNAPPAKLSDGMLVYADGTNWDPGSGRGLYERRSSAWFKL
jgi:hypothetical protein